MAMSDQQVSDHMQDQSLRADFGARLKALRKQHNILQKELAAKLGVQRAQLNKYESGLHAPPLEKIARIAAIFGVTVDYLVTGNQPDLGAVSNPRLVERLKAMTSFPPDDQDAVLRLIDAMIYKHRVEGAMRPMGSLVG
jgi:transcriptional regulator with XRE-family HTH domain